MIRFVSLYLASPNILGSLTKLQSGLQNTLGPTENATSNDETKGKLSTSQPVPDNQNAQPMNGPTISGKTQVREASKEGHPVVVLMGYELGETSSKRVHDVLKNPDAGPSVNPGSMNKIDVLQSAKDRLTLRENSTSYVKGGQAVKSAERNTTEKVIPDSELQEIAELLDNAASASMHLHDDNYNKQYTHEGKNEHNVNANTLQSKMHAAAGLYSEATSALQSNVTSDKGSLNKDAILPISSDDVVTQQAFQRMTALGSHIPYKEHGMHDQPDTPGVNLTRVNGTLKGYNSEGMQTEYLSRIVAGNKHHNIIDPLWQVSA